MAYLAERRKERKKLQDKANRILSAKFSTTNKNNLLNNIINRNSLEDSNIKCKKTKNFF